MHVKMDYGMIVRKGRMATSPLIVATVVTLFGAGCRQNAYSLNLPEKKESNGGSIDLVAPVLPALALPDPNRIFDWSLLDFDGFYPPACEKIEPNGLVRLTFAPYQSVRFPTTERYSSPDRRYSLVHDGLERRKKKIFHWLLLLSENEPVPKSVFGTEQAFDVLWAPDSGHFSITHYPGSNMSTVVVFSSKDLNKQEISARAAALPYFVGGISERAISKAYRWTTDGELIVRGLGRSESEPYDLIGFEVIADCRSSSGSAQLRFLRGFVCHGK